MMAVRAHLISTHPVVDGTKVKVICQGHLSNTLVTLFKKQLPLVGINVSDTFSGVYWNQPDHLSVCSSVYKILFSKHW